MYMTDRKNIETDHHDFSSSSYVDRLSRKEIDLLWMVVTICRLDPTPEQIERVLTTPGS